MSIRGFLKSFTKERLERIELVIRIFAIAVAAIWAIYTFHYQNSTLPSFEPTSLNFKSTFIKQSEDDSFYFYKLNINVENNSKIQEKCIAFFNIDGYRWAYLPNNSMFNIWQNVNLKVSDYLRNFEYADSTNFELAYGKIMDDNTILNPGQQFSVEDIIPIKKHTTGIADLTMNGIVIKKKGNMIPSYFIDSSGYLTYSLKVVNSSFFKNDTTDFYSITKKDKNFTDKNGVYFTSTLNSYLIDSSLYIR